jgi:type IV secretion system protein TrbL
VCIIEYYVVSAVGMLLVPCVLFEGTREFAKKLLGLFAAYFVKIIVMSLAVFWAFSAFISMGNDIIGSNNPIGLLSFANFLFTCLLCWLVVREAPKIAQGLLSGSPSLGMGDFLQAVGTAALGAGIAARAVGTAASAPFAAGSKIAHAVKERRAERDARQFRGQILGTLGAAPGNGTGTAASTAGVNSRALYGATISFGDDAGARVKNKEGNAAFLPAPAQDASRSKSEDKAVKETAPAGTTPDAAEGLKRPPAQSLTPPAALTTARNSASSKANAEAAGLDADKPDK